MNEIVVADTGNINVYAGLTLKSNQDSIMLNYDTILLCPYAYNWVFFVDDHPIVGWAHPCRYIFLDSLTGAYQIVDQNQYPACFRDADCSEYEVVSQIYYYPPVTMPPNQNTPDYATTNNNLYAVLIVTQDAEQYPGNMPNRFWNDVSVVYNTLIQVYGYSDDNIYVHYYDGTSPRNGNDLNEPDDENHFDYSASKSRILETFKNLSGEIDTDPDLYELGPSDQLFIYVDGHGLNKNGHSTIECKQPGQPYESLYDSELAESVDEMNCAQMIFLFQPCKSGNFAYELTDYNYYDVACENRIVHTSTTIDFYSTSEHYLTGDRYTEFTYYWTAAVRGFYPVDDEPWVPSIYATGSFPFDELYPFDDHDDDYNPDENNDGFVQMEEAFLYADDMDAWSPNGYHHPDPACWECYEEPVNENEMGCENLTTLYGLAGTVENTQTVESRNYLIGGNLEIDPTVTITFENGTNLYLGNENAQINVLSDASMILEDNLTITGTNSNNQIEVNGVLEVGQNVSFTSTGPYWDLYLINNEMQAVFNNTTFEKCKLNSYCSSLNISYSTFNDCYAANSYRGNVTVTNTTFDRTWLYLANRWIFIPFTATVNNCNFFNDEPSNSKVGIDLWWYDKFFITNNNINGFYNGIQIINAGNGISGNQNICENEIYNSYYSGLCIYTSTASIGGNYIHNNKYGVRLFDNSNIALYGNPGATTYAETQQITDNDSYEVYASQYSFPWYFRNNVIIDEDNTGNPNDPMVYHYHRNYMYRDVRYNC